MKHLCQVSIQKVKRFPFPGNTTSASLFSGTWCLVLPPFLLTPCWKLWRNSGTSRNISGLFNQSASLFSGVWCLVLPPSLPTTVENFGEILEHLVIHPDFWTIGDLFTRKAANNFRRCIVAWRSPEVWIKFSLEKKMKYLWLLFSSAATVFYLFRAVEDIGDNWKRTKKKKKNYGRRFRRKFGE